jgi:hypothetical protein
VAKGVVDVHVSKDLEDNAIILVVDCASGLPNDLNTISSGTRLTLQRGDVSSEMKVVHEHNHENSFNYMEVNADTASRFGIKDGMRFILSYDSNEKLLQMYRLIISRAYGLLLPDSSRYKENTITIGYTLLSWLGISDTVSYITVTKGATSKRFRVRIPENQLDDDFRLSPTHMKAFQLPPRKRFKLEYNQSSKTLHLNTVAVAAVSKRPKRSPLPLQRKKRK